MNANGTADHHLLAQLSILRKLAGGAPAHEVLSAIIDLAEAARPGSIAGVTIVDRAAHSLESAIFPSVDPIFASSIAGVPLGPPHVGTCAQALYRGEVVTSEDLLTDTRFSAEWIGLCEANDIRSCLSHPILSDHGIPLGTFMLCFRSARGPDTEDREIIGICAELTKFTLLQRSKADHQSVLMGEIQHRTSNLFTVIQALARASFAGGAGAEVYREVFEPRLLALSCAHRRIFAESGMDLKSLLLELLRAYGGEERIKMSGPGLTLSPEATLALSIAIHELATNATKYGALSSEAGKVRITWDAGCGTAPEQRVEIRWSEMNGPAVSPPSREGFGSKAIKQLVAKELEGDVAFSYAAEGLVCTISAPSGRVLVPSPASAG